MSEQTVYKRFATIERAEGDPSGVVRGIIATDGEASDGHILSMAGAECVAPAPMLFGHDAWDKRGTVGSWAKFTIDKVVRGEGAIETGGVGAAAEERADLAYMVDRGLFRALSVRWEETEPPIRRVNLSKDHPAFVDAATEKDYRKLYGYFFPRWRLLEASIVPLGADPSAVIGRARETTGSVRKLWQRVARELVLGDAVRGDLADKIEHFKRSCADLRAAGVDDFGTLLRLAGLDALDASKMREVLLDNGHRYLIPEELHDKLDRGSVERLRWAFDLLEFDDDSRLAGDDAQLELEPEDPAERAPTMDEPQGTTPAPLDLDAVRSVVSGEIARQTEDVKRAVRESVRAAAGR